MTQSAKSSYKIAPFMIGMILGVTVSVVSFFGYITLFGMNSTNQIMEQTTSSLSPAPEKSIQNEAADKLTLPSSLVNDWRQLWDYTSNYDRTAHLYDMLLKVGESDLLQLLDESKKILHDDQRRMVEIAVFRRLTTIDPQTAIQHLDAYPTNHTEALVQGIFHEWSFSDLDASVEAAMLLDRPTRIQALHTILQTRNDLPEADLVEIAQQIDNEVYALRWISELNATIQVANPEHAWNLIVSDDVSDIYQLELLIDVSKNWIEQDGIDILSHLEAIALDLQYPYFKRYLLEAIAEDDPHSMFEYAASLPADKQYPVAVALYTTWIKSDPESAYNSLDSFKGLGAFNLLEHEVLNAWARHDPYELIEKVDMLSAENQLQAIEDAVIVVARSNPKDALELMNKMSANVGNTSSISVLLAEEWAKQDAKEALKWVLSDSQTENPKRLSALESVLTHVARTDPRFAMEVALDEPESSSRDLEIRVMSELARTDVELAVEMLSKVRGAARTVSYSTVGSALVSIGEPLRGLTLVNDLEPRDRAFCQNLISVKWARESPMQVFDSLDRLPTEEMQSIVAKNLIINNIYQPVLTSDQVEKSKSFLSEAHQKEVARRLEPTQ